MCRDKAVLSISVSPSPKDTELGSSWKQRPPARDIPPSAAVSVTQQCCVSSKRPPSFPLHDHQPTLLTRHQGATLITYFMTGASLSLSESSPFLSPCLSSCCLVTSEPGLVNKSQIDSTADCLWVLATCDPTRLDVLAAGWSRGEKQTDSSQLCQL